jgi:hypothetical protein
VSSVGVVSDRPPDELGGLLLIFIAHNGYDRQGRASALNDVE